MTQPLTPPVEQVDREAAREWLQDVCGKHLANRQEHQMLAERFARHRHSTRQPEHATAGREPDAYLIADDRSVSLAECPIGLFMCGGELCLKTEYGNNEGRIDAYIVSSGEFFWGAQPQTIANQRAQRVVPVSVVGVDTPAALSAAAILPGREEIAREVKEALRDDYTDSGMEDAFFRWPVIERAILARQRGGGEATERSSKEPRVSEQSAAVTPSQPDCTADTASSEVERVAGTPLQADAVEQLGKGYRDSTEPQPPQEWIDAADKAAERVYEAFGSIEADAVERALRQTLEKCRAQFEFYVTAHMNKQPPDMEKAATNQEFVELIDAALTPAQDQEERG